MEEPIYKIGFWSALVAFVAAFGFDVAQILQLIGIVIFISRSFENPCILRSPAL